MTGIIILKSMEEFIRERAKHRAIAVYTFNSINCDGKTTIRSSKLRDSLRVVLHQFNPGVQMDDVDKIIQNVDKFQRQ